MLVKGYFISLDFRQSYPYNHEALPVIFTSLMLGVGLARLEQYLYLETNHDRSNWPNYKSRFLRISAFFTSLDFTPDNIAKFLLTLENLSTSSRDVYFDMLWYICRILKVDYMQSFKRPKKVNRKKNILYSFEMKKLLDTTYNKWYQMGLAFELALRCGLRYGEIRRLRWEDISGNDLILRDTKSGHDQMVYLTDDLVVKIRKIEKKFPYIFQSVYGRFSNNVANAFLKKTLCEIGIDKQFSFHDLRHSAASDLADKDINMKVIQMFMRHKFMSTTERYVHIHPYKLMEVARRHSLATHNWTREDLIKEVVKFEKTILDTNFKPSIEYKQNEVEIRISY